MKGAGGLAAQALILSVRESEGTQGLQAPPAPTCTATLCPATGYTVPQGPPVKNSQPLNYRAGWWPGWVPGSLARSKEIPAGSAPCSACKTLCSLLCLPGPQFPCRKLKYTLPGLAVYHVLAYIPPAWSLGPCCPQGSHCPLQASGGQATSHRVGKP